MSNSLLNKNIIVSVCGGGKPLSDNNSKSKLLTQLQTLRAFAFIGVFICHTQILNNVLECVGLFGVSVFFVLSGFVMVYSYYGKQRIKNVSFVSNVKFAYSKLKRLWLLSILCTLALTIFLIVGSANFPLWNVALKFVLNAVWLQEWLPLFGRSINAVNWFLCTTLFGYFIFPWFLRLLETNYSKNKAILCIILCLAVEIVVAYIGSKFPCEERSVNGLMDHDLTFWFVYGFPLTRIVDIIIGFNLGYLFVNKETAFSVSKTTILEILGIVLAILGNYYYSTMSPRFHIGEQVIMTDPFRSWSYTLGFVLSSMLLVYTFAMQNGVISKMLTNRVTLYIAKLSPYAFLIHYVVFRYLAFIYYHLPGVEGNEFYLTYGCWINLTLGFGITIIATEIWMRLYAKFFAPKTAS